MTPMILGVLSTLLLAQAQSVPPLPPLSAFKMKEAESVIRNRLPCLGCHELDGEGGRIGPSLGNLSGRRPPEYVYRMIADPQHTAPGSMMPRVAMSEATRRLVVSYLLQRPATAPTDNTQIGARSVDTARTAAALYGRFCAACHGAAGKGDGPNARFLTVRPTNHANAGYMSTRTDDDLFDTIYAGGYVMNRSNRMPPFGGTLTRPQIHALVQYLRSLCRCDGPAWSRSP